MVAIKDQWHFLIYQSFLSVHNPVNWIETFLCHIIQRFCGVVTLAAAILISHMVALFTVTHM